MLVLLDVSLVFFIFFARGMIGGGGSGCTENRSTVGGGEECSVGHS